MASFGRSMEKFATAVADFAGGVNQRLDENHLVDMLVELKDEEISVDEFKEFTTTIRELRSGKPKTKATTTATTNS